MNTALNITPNATQDDNGVYWQGKPVSITDWQRLRMAELYMGMDIYGNKDKKIITPKGLMIKD